MGAEKVEDKYIKSSMAFWYKYNKCHTAVMLVKYHLMQIWICRKKIKALYPDVIGKTAKEKAYLAGYKKCLSDVLKITQP